MMKFMIKRFLSNYDKEETVKIRETYGILSGAIGIIANIVLFGIKLISGMIMNSIAIISDAFNNLSDSFSSLVTLVGARISGKPPDKEHPYGHGRFEYIASLVVAFIIFTMAFQLFIESYQKITKPEPVEWNIIAFCILFVSVFIKLWMFFFNRRIAKKINSSLVMANAKDSLSDVIATTGIIIGTAIDPLVTFPIDGLLGMIISGLIFYTGFTIARDSIHNLLGPSPDPELFEQIQAIVSENKMIKNAHNFHIHDYGPWKKLASLHVVLPAHISVKKAHSIIHELEERIKKELAIDIVIHVDPDNATDED